MTAFWQVSPSLSLENPKLALLDMGLLTKSESGDEDFLKESEKQNIGRFFNRLLSLEVDRQNALFEYFYKTYTETVEHLKASGKYDLGLEDIKAKSVKMGREPQLIHRDSITGATTHLYELETIVATAPAHFDDLERTEGIYFYRKLGADAPEFVAARASLVHTDPETAKAIKLTPSAVRREETSSEIFQNVLYGKESLELVENIRLKSSKVFGDFYVEIVPGYATHPKKFRAAGLVSIMQNSRERFLLPQNESEAVALLQKLVSQFPPVAGAANFIDITQSEKLAEPRNNSFIQPVEEEPAPIDVREWLIEPDTQELALVSLSDLLIND